MRREDRRRTSTTRTPERQGTVARVVINSGAVAALKADVHDSGADVALAIATDMETFAAVRTGAMKASVDVDDNGDSFRISAGRGLPDNRHIFNEFGTHNEDGSERMAAQPFIRPAVYQQRPMS